jgi:hypothetical protein
MSTLLGNWLSQREYKPIRGAWKGTPHFCQPTSRISYEEVAKDLREHYQTTGTRNMEGAEYRLKHLDGFFAGQRIAGINPARIIAYVAKRQEEGAANATINRELETLGKMLKLAYENNKLMRLPIIHKLAANPP